MRKLISRSIVSVINDGICMSRVEDNMEQTEHFYVITRRGERRRLLLWGVLRSVLFASVILTSLSTKARAQGTCESLKSFTAPYTTITSALLHPGGKYVSTDGFNLTFADLPPSCQVTASIKPAQDADIKVQIWLPMQRYNGRYLGTGNAGYGGNILDSELAQGINNGFATANTDLGTCPRCALTDKTNQLVGHSEKWRDFGWLSTHLMTVFSKALIKEFYEAPATHAYFSGCSTGGQQALMEATRFPDDYDGILAGAPAFNRTHLHMLLISQYKASHLQPEGRVAQVPMWMESLAIDAGVRELSFAAGLLEVHKREDQLFAIERALGVTIPSSEELQKKLDAVNTAVLKACRKEPKTDNFLTDPRECKFEPKTLQCPGDIDQADCLTKDQVTAMEVYYGGAINPRTGAIIHPGNVPGSETSDPDAAGFAYNLIWSEPTFDSLFKWVFGKNWNWEKFDFDKDVETVDTVLAGDLNALDESKIADDGNKRADLQKFKDRGGKLILYSGWADPLIPPPVTINYFNAVTKTMFGDLSPEAVRKTQEFTRLFMAPGMWHCGVSIAPGPGPNAFGGVLQQPAPTFDPQHDLLSTLTQWVEQDIAPTSVIATKYTDDQPPAVAMQRPICAFPKVPRYDGIGNANDPNSFECVSSHPPDYNNQTPASIYAP
jgi:feruloyl esterase